MQRPTRIVVFGVLCLLMGAGSGVKNLSELIVSLAGPQMLEQAMGMLESQGQPLSDSNRENIEIQIAALSKPAFRVMQGIKSAVASVAALVLLVAGFGLLRSLPWSLKLARLWAWAALVIAVATVVLQIRFIVPEMTGVDSTAAIMGGIFMLPIFWALPVCILTLLSRPIVTDYLRWRAGQGRGVMQPAPAAPVGSNTTQAPTPQQSQPPGPEPGPRPADTNQADQTWRDDPWNDSGAR